MFKKRNIKKQEINLSQIKEQDDAQPNGQPKKKVKIQKTQFSNTIGGTTNTRKIENQQAVHKEFQSLAYKKGNNNQQLILNGDQAFDHETQQAKKRYLQNVQMTKKIKQGKLSSKIYRVRTHMQIISLVKMNYKIPSSIINGSTAQQEIIPLIVQKILVDLIMTQAYVKIGMTLAIVFLVTAVFIYMIVATTKQLGIVKDYEKSERQRWRRIMNPDINEDPDYIKDLQKFKPIQICKVCNLQFKDPVQVSCSHIFCKKCANQIFSKDSKCPECKKILNGIMNNAQKTIANKIKNYEQMVRSAKKANQMAKVKRVNHKDANSLNVFTAQ